MTEFVPVRITLPPGRKTSTQSGSPYLQVERRQHILAEPIYYQINNIQAVTTNVSPYLQVERRQHILAEPIYYQINTIQAVTTNVSPYLQVERRQHILAEPIYYQINTVYKQSLPMCHHLYNQLRILLSYHLLQLMLIAEKQTNIFIAFYFPTN